MIGSVSQSSSYAYDRFAVSPGKPVAPAAASTLTASGTNTPGSALSPTEQRQVEKLAATDRKVRAHEQAHISAGGALVRSGANFTYQTGPDGKRYAVGGEVDIDASPGGTPQETLAKAERLRAAAQAPADPSSQDRQVAAQASRMEMEARQALARREVGETSSGYRQQAVAAYQAQTFVASTSFSAVA